ncbi:response regulator transcription factor [Staphylococcus chromogenes]|nr:response regulator transcription factor [Staphylococcus chromogenes]
MQPFIDVLLVDDSPLVLSTLRRYLETTHDIRVVAEASNGEEALEQLQLHDVDLVLADIHMPTMDGPTLLSRINQLPKRPVFVAVTAFDSDRTMLQILKLGGAGYVLKSERPRVIIDAIRDAVAGGMVVSPQAMTRLVQYLNNDVPQRAFDPLQEALKLETLTEAEKKTLVLLCKGQSNAEMATALNVTESTVKKHVSSVISQFGATSRLNLVAKVLGATYD